MKEYILMFKNALNFSGKSSRREFWMAILFNCIANALLFVFTLPFLLNPDVAVTAYNSVASLYEIVVFLPLLSLTVRRLRDTGKSGWWVLLGLLSGIGQIILIIWLSKPSTFRVKAWYAGYKDNPDKIVLEEEQNNTSKNQASQDSSATQNADKQNNKDSIEKIIAELNELKANNKISDQEYNEIMSKLIKK